MASSVCGSLSWPAKRAARAAGALSCRAQWRHYHGFQDGRNRLSDLWAPIRGVSPPKNEDAHDKLIRAGFIRQSHSGLYQMLPFGLRVQEKLEKLIDKHMRQLGASKVALSSLSPQALWEKSGRLSKAQSELFCLTDRKDVGYLLSPTHEEEITSLVAHTVRSYRDLPLRLYQITRKYRDEPRPRGGLLRGREFLMKDLYTFDISTNKAIKAYQKVQAAYVRIFRELSLPVLVAKASSGDMGGDMSHEYHLPSSLGEDTVVSCRNCGYTVNEEVADNSFRPRECSPAEARAAFWRGITKDKGTLVIVWYPDTSTAGIRTGAIKSVVPDFDASIDLNRNIEGVLAHFSWAKTDDRSLRILNLIDGRLPQSLCHGLDVAEVLQRTGLESLDPRHYEIQTLTADDGGKPLNLLNISPGDKCPKCINGSLRVDKAIELGHTFHLGTRYSKPFEAKVEVPCEILYERETPEEAAANEDAPANEATFTEKATYADGKPSAHGENAPLAEDPALGEKPGHGVLDPAYRLPPLEKPAQGEIPAYEKDETEMVHMEMGCHGIGVSRLMAAVAHHNADDHSLNWPRKIAPYDVVIIPRQSLASSAVEVYDFMTAWAKNKGLDIDVVIDDRPLNIGWMFSHANLVGYPIIVVVDKAWQSDGEVEVQCRRLGVSERRSLRDMPGYIHELLSLCK